MCIKWIHLSWNICLCLSLGGRIFSWGWNEHGMCGDGSLCDIAQPRPIPHLRDATALLIGCGSGHSMALCSLKSNKDSASWTGLSIWLSVCDKDCLLAYVMVLMYYSERLGWAFKWQFFDQSLRNANTTHGCTHYWEAPKINIFRNKNTRCICSHHLNEIYFKGIF